MTSSCLCSASSQTVSFYNKDERGEIQRVSFNNNRVKQIFHGSFHKVNAGRGPGSGRGQPCGSVREGACSSCRDTRLENMGSAPFVLNNELRAGQRRREAASDGDLPARRCNNPESDLQQLHLLQALTHLQHQAAPSLCCPRLSGGRTVSLAATCPA